MMKSTWSVSVLYSLLLLVTASVALPENQPYIDLTSYFAVSSTSVCGDPPTLYESPRNSGNFQSCTGSEYSIDNTVDGNASTRWQSANGETPVEVSFSLLQPAASLGLRGIRLTTGSGPPRYLYLQEKRPGEQNYTTLRVYVVNASTDCEGFANCEEYTVEEVFPDGGVVLLCPGTFTEPVTELRMRIDGFQEHFQNETSQYYILYEVQLLGWVAEGHYVRSLIAVSVEGEMGYPVTLDSPVTERVPTSTDETLIGGFSSRGFATFSVNIKSRETFEWEFPSVPQTTSYQVWLGYTNPGGDTPLGAMVISEEQFFNARVIFRTCPPPNICHTPLVMPNDITTIASFMLLSGEVSIIALTLSNIDLNIDVIFTVPMAFYEATVLQDESNRFLESCDFIGGSLGQGTTDEQFCLESAVELSLSFYQSTYVCGCSDVGAASDECAVYRGQCDCTDQSDGFSRITGRRCDMCPFLTYLTANGCTECGCMGSADINCDVSTGQCPCPPLVTGRTCDSCMAGSYGDPLLGCSVCTCDAVGTEYCNDTTGECVCRGGVTGVSCDVCEGGRYNLTSLGCEECGCDSVGSVGGDCDDIGQCTCQSNAGGLKCSSCLPGAFFLTSDGCTRCSCSGRSNDCSQNPNVTSEPSEVCVCPVPYEGTSCDRCSAGWFMSDTTGDCEPCQCNGLADTCHDGTGTCLGCRGNSTGAGCDVCISGYYDADPTDPSLTCLPCPCTAITALNILCVADSAGSPVCNCLPGHEGLTCDSCSEGYFGDPPQFRCTQCDCNGNIDPSEPGSCDRETGRCVRCINNSTGNECEICAPGVYGNATQQDCQPCDCNIPGADSSLCDNQTGQCSCLSGVNGRRCEQCLPTYWNFVAGVGCELCACEGSVVSDMCDVVTGECECESGVGGRDCDYCLPGFFNFSTENGCTACGCGEGAVNDSCTEEGQCYCQPGVGGAKCDLCEPFTFNLSTSGCESCGGCAQSLRRDLERQDAVLRNVSDQAELLRQLSAVDMEGLGEVERVASVLRGDIEGIAVTLSEIETQLDIVNDNHMTTQETVSRIDERVANSTSVTFELQPVAEEVGDYIQEIYNEMQRGLVQLVDSTAYAEAVLPLIVQHAGRAEEIASRVMEIREMHGGNFSDDIWAVQSVIEWANRIAGEVARARNLSQSLSGEAVNLIGRFQGITDDVKMMSPSVEAVNDTFLRVQRSIEEAETVIYDLVDDVIIINYVIDQSQTEIENVELVIAGVNTTLTEVCDAVDQLSVWIGNETPDVFGSGTELLEPESDHKLAGSGMGLVPETVLGGLSALCEGVESVEVEVGRCEETVETAVNYSNTLQQDAQVICSVLSESLTAGGVAVEAILNYTSSIEAIEEAIRVTMETREVLGEVESMGIMGGDLEREAWQLLWRSQRLLNEAKTEADRAADLVRGVEMAEGVVAEAEARANSSGQAVGELEQTVSSLATLTASTITQSSEDISSIKSSYNVTSTAHTSLLTLLTSLHDNVSSTMTTVDETIENFDLTQTIIDSANTTIMDIRSEFVELRGQLEQVEEVQVSNGNDLANLASGLAALREELERAKRAAAEIDVALRFYGNSSLGYDNTGLIADDSATRISLVFNPSETTGLMLHSSAGGDGQLALSLENGSVVFETEVGGVEGVEHVSTEPGVIQKDTWYQLYATREGVTSQLSVSELQGGVTYTSSSSSPSPSPLSLPSNGTLYLGGSPTHVARGYSGCLDRLVVNNSPVPLLLPDQLDGQPLQYCGLRPPSEAPRPLETGVWLQGGGSYVQVVTSLITGSSPFSIQLVFRTFANDGLLLALYSEDMAQRLAVVVVDGRLTLQFSRDVITMATAVTVGVVNDGEWHVAEVEVNGTAAFLLVDSNERVNASTVMSLATFQPSSQRLFIGGLPSTVQRTIGSSEISLAGCVRYLRVAGVMVTLDSTHNSSRASFGGCPSSVVSGVRFMGEGLAVFPPSAEDVSHISFQFHSTQLASLILYIGNEATSIVVSLYHTRLRVDGPGTVLYSIQDGLNDDAWHYVVLELGNDGMNLTVDAETVTTPTSGSTLPVGSDIMVGGVTPPISIAVTESFRGCVDQLVINNRLVDFSQAVSLEGVALYGCRPRSIPVTTPLPPPPPPPLPPPPSTDPNISVGLNGQDGSFLAISINQRELAQSHILTIQFQTSSPNAMLLYAQGNIDFLALELIRGFLYYTYNLGSGRVILSSVYTYNDGLEHVVELRRRGRNGTMEIDRGSEVVSGVSPGTFTSLNVAMGILFIGGAPLALPPSNLITYRTTGEEVPPSTRGCVLSLAINAVYVNLSSPQASSGAEECLEFYNNVATFLGTGYLQLLDEVDGGVEFSASLEFRTNSCTGLLLYTASSLHPDHLALELVDGVVRFIFDNGAGATIVEYLPPTPLCDDQWHSVSLVKNEITGAVSVDEAEPVMQDSAVVNFVSLELNSPLFIGGVPNVQALRATVLSSQVESSGFVGCIRNLYVSSSRTGPLERDLAQAFHSSGVTFHTCNP